MQMSEPMLVIKVSHLLQEFLSGEIPATTMIKEYDDLLNEAHEEMNGDRRFAAIDGFQTELSLYVENPDWRRQSKLYYGDDALREKVNGFLTLLNRMTPPPVDNRSGGC
jgi:hypothetical protein